jgi:hypothetical protein
MFDGKNVIDWVFKISTYINAVDESASDLSKIKFAANCLTGRALTWWRHQLMIGM